jgi:multidrug efflux pump subunit AcrB
VSVFNFFIRNPILVAVGALLVCLFGVLAVLRVPIQMIPDLDVRTISVLTRWPGATPQDVEREIIIEQEDYLRGIPGVSRMTSKASMGRGEIELEFPHGTDINEVLIRVNNALSQVPEYPENVDEPTLITQSFSTAPFMFLTVTALEQNPLNVDVLAMHDFVDDKIAPYFERVPGVAEASLAGGAERQIRLQVDPAALAERGISIPELRNAIRGRNRDLSGGDLDSGKRRYLIRTIGRFDSVSEIEDMVIARRGSSLIRLRDVGRAELGLAETRFMSFFAGEPSMVIRIRRQPGTNVVRVRDAVVAAMTGLNAGMLRDVGLRLVVTGEDARYVEEAAANVRQNLVLGALLATAVLFLFLRSWKATLIGGIGIPICTLAAFVGLLVTGRTINVISLAGIAFAIGMTLDNSIVVLENIYRHRAAGKRPVDAALDGVGEVWRAVLASTLTTVFVFIPVLFVQQEAGQLYSDIAVAISSSILMSMVVAVAVVPTACRRIMRMGDTVGGGTGRLASSGARFATGVTRAVDWLHGRQRRCLAAVMIVVAMALSIILLLTPKANYLPEGEEKKVFAQLFPPPGYSLQELEAAAKVVSSHFVPYIGQDPALFDRGESPVPGLDIFNQIGSVSGVMAIAEVTKRSHVDEIVELLSEELAEVPGMNSFVARGSIFVSSRGGARSINIDITGPRLDDLYDAAFAVFMRARTVLERAQVRADPSSLIMGQPVLEIRPDWERAAELGFEASEIGYLVWAFSDGAFVDEFYLEDDKIDMFLYSTSGTIQHPGDLESLFIYSPEGGIVPLSAVARVEETLTTDIIRRVDGGRTITVSIVPPSSVPLETAVEMVERDLVNYLYQNGEVDPSISMQISGASDLLTATREALTSNFVIAIVISYLLLVAILSHWGFPLVIMLSVPIGISGGILGLWLLNAIGGHLDLIGLDAINQPFDMITMLGFLILIGTVVNNPILIVEKTMISSRAGVPNTQAVLDAVRSRLRPILMSTITTVFGLSPLVFLPGPGSELYRGLGAVVLFGLLFSALITLFFLPAVLGLVLAARDRLRGVRRMAAARSSS